MAAVGPPATSSRRHDPLSRTFLEDGPKVLSALIRQVGDFDLAEDALQDAMAEALVAWKRDGLPKNGGAWLMTAARRRALDRLRRARVRSDPRHLHHLADRFEREMAAGELDSDDAVPDERLRLIFTCCHPALPHQARVALTLRTLVFGDLRRTRGRRQP